MNFGLGVRVTIVNGDARRRWKILQAGLLREWILLIVACIATASVIIFWICQTAAHQKRVQAIKIRVHVNGIRGKSTIVRYVAGALRAHGITTLAKTTGSDTRVIYPDGSEEPVNRRGAPTILEQIDVLRWAKQHDLEAIVFECMALRPEYQRVSERRMICATDSVIANIRRDHVEQLGATPAEIALSLSATVPLGAPLYTAEDDPDVLAVLENEAKKRGSWLVRVARDEVTHRELRGFSPLDFPENIALALAIACANGVSRQVALKGMREARPDPGASKIHFHELNSGTLVWIDLFGVNDVQSAEVNIRAVTNWVGNEGELVLLINNREDRQDRSEDFARMVADNGIAAKAFLVGEALAPLSRAIRGRNPEMHVEKLKIPLEPVPEDIATLVNGDPKNLLVLVGLANIHTEDASRLRRALETPHTEWVPSVAEYERW